MSIWYSKRTAEFYDKKSKSVIHPFTVRKYKCSTLNVYQGYQHRCGHCYVTYEGSP